MANDKPHGPIYLTVKQSPEDKKDIVITGVDPRSHADIKQTWDEIANTFDALPPLLKKWFINGLKRTESESVDFGVWVGPGSNMNQMKKDTNALIVKIIAAGLPTSTLSVDVLNFSANK